MFDFVQVQEDRGMEKPAFTKEESLALKSVAVLLIIMHHSISGTSVYWGFALNFFPFSESQVNHIGAYCKICVGIFAFISGYGIAKKCQNSKKTIAQQAISQYISSMTAFWPVFAICILVTAAINGRPFTVYAGNFPLQSLMNFLLDGLGIAKLMGTPNLDGSWWYLSAMTVFCFVIPLFQVAIRRMGWLMPTFVLIAFPRLIGMGYLPGADTLPFYFLMAVLAGVIFAEYDLFERIDTLQPVKSWGNTSNQLLRLVIAFVLLLISYKAFHHLPIVNFWEYQYAIAPLIFILFFHECMRLVPMLKYPLACLGKHSGNIYFIHGLLLGHYLRNFLFSMPWFMLTPLVTYAIGLGFSVVLKAGSAYLRKGFAAQPEQNQFKSFKDHLFGYWRCESLRTIISPCLFAMMLLLMDQGLRGLHPEAGTAAVYDLIPQLFTFAWITILTAITLLFPRAFRKITIGVIGGVFLLLFLVHSMMIQAKGNFFSFNSLMYATDGFQFLDASYIRVSSQIWCIFLLAAIMLVLSIMLVPQKGSSIGKITIFLLLIIVGAGGLNLIRDKYLSDRLENHGETYSNYNGVLYHNFSDANACLKLCGLYQYTFRDFCITYGVYDRINQLNYAHQFSVLDEWYENKAPDPDNEWTGRFSGKNLFLIQLEAIDSWMITEQFMPNLYRIQQSSLNFTSHYSPMYSDAGTLNTEMLANTSCIMPFAGARSSMYNRNSYPYSLPALMRAKGYRANSFHRSPPTVYNRGDIHTNWGYEKYYSGEDMGIPTEELDFDTALMRAYKLMTPNEPFLSFIVTYSAHGPYEYTPLSERYFDTAKELLPPDADEMLIHAIARAKVTDEFIGQLYNKLETDGLLDNTVLAFYSDHFDYYAGWDLILETKCVENFDMASNTPFFIYEKNTAPLEIKKVTSSVDILPTLANLFALDTDGRYYVGNDAFSQNGGYVIFKNFSWYDGETYWNTAAPGELMPKIQMRNEELMRRLEMSWASMKINYFADVES